MSRVRIHYLRPPDDLQVFHQELLLDREDVKITLASRIPFDPPLRVDDRVVLESGSDVVWFTFPGRWHDIGRFHRADGTFTGIYGNVLTPPTFEAGGIWRTTDLFLDVWLGADQPGEPRLLDEEELDEAEARGWVAPESAERARQEARHLLREAQAGRWPPPVVHEWTLERARQRSAHP